MMSSIPIRSPVMVWSERALFFRQWLRNPLAIGALLPSGRTVARVMADQLPVRRSGHVLELGGGTGSLTQGLLEAGCRSDELIVLEREPALAAALRQRFPQLVVAEADARGVGEVLAGLGITSLAGVVSSLPIKWFALDGQRAIVDGCFAHLARDGVFLQLTNALVSPLPMRALGVVGTEVARVWAAFPPVQIWRYRRAEPGNPAAAQRPVWLPRRARFAGPPEGRPQRSHRLLIST